MAERTKTINEKALHYKGVAKKAKELLKYKIPNNETIAVDKSTLLYVKRYINNLISIEFYSLADNKVASADLCLEQLLCAKGNGKKSVKRFIADILFEMSGSGTNLDNLEKIAEEHGIDHNKKNYFFKLMERITSNEYITKEEVSFIGKRIVSYIMDFSFNDSSDFVLLSNLLFEELLQERMQQKLMKPSSKKEEISNSRDITTILNESSKRIQSTLKALGITAEQRLKKMSSTSTIVELVAQYEESLAEFPELEKIFLLEEIDMLLQKYSRGEITKLEFSILCRDFDIEDARAYFAENIDIYRTHITKKVGAETANKVITQILETDL